jgi:SAM-dependent methyltransferase
MRWVETVTKDHIIVAPILEVGSCNVNGSVRSLFPTPYIGVDVVEGPSVDRVIESDDRLPFEDGIFGTVVSTECLEHAIDPVELLDEMVRVLRPGGLLIVTMRGNGFQRHNPPDRWRVMPGTLRDLLQSWGLQDVVEIPDPQVSGSFVLGRVSVEEAEQEQA